MSRDPREVERIRNPNKMRRQRSNTSAATRNTLSSLSSNNSISSSTASSIRKSPTSTIITTFIKEEESTQEDEEEDEIVEGLEILLAPRTVRKSSPPTAHTMDVPSSLQGQKQPDINTSKGKTDLKQWASRLVTQKRRAKNTGNEKLRAATPLANALSDVSEGNPHRERMFERERQISAANVSKSSSLATKPASTMHNISTMQVHETDDILAYPDDEFNEWSSRAVKTPHSFNPVSNISADKIRKRTDTSLEDETPIRTNTTSSKPFKINQINNDLFFVPRSNFIEQNNNPVNYAQSELYQRQEPRLTPIVPSRHNSISQHVVPVQQKILMTPPPIKSRVPNHSLMHVNVLTPDYPSAPTEIQKTIGSEQNTQNINQRLGDSVVTKNNTSSATIEKTVIDDLLFDKSGEDKISGVAHSSSSAHALPPRASVVAKSKEVLVEQWLTAKCRYLHPDDLRSYAKKLTDMGFDSKMMLENELRADDLNFMKVAHKRVFLSSLGL